MIFNKSQTATEYLVILSVVIVIALLVVSILGGIPILGRSSDSGVSNTVLANAQVGIMAHAISDYDTILFLRNNGGDSISIDAINVGGNDCVPFTQVVLTPGKEKEITCASISKFEENFYSDQIIINYTDKKTTASYSQNDETLILRNDVTTKYLSVLASNQYWNSSIEGCWNDIVDPHPLCTCIDLQKINSNSTTLQSDYILENNVDVDRCAHVFGGVAVGYAANWTPIGNAGSEYNGTFDGQNNHVKGIKIIGERSLGLFGDIDPASGSSATLRNIGVIDADIVGTNHELGGLAGLANYATITNSYATSTIVGINNIGALVGYGRGISISNSYATGQISGNNFVGGLVGYSPLSDYSGNHASVSVNGSFKVGGLIGSGESTNVSNSYATGTVTGSWDYVGGLVGYAFGGRITNSYATGSVTGSLVRYGVGGLVGQAGSTTISGSHASGTVTGGSYVGGLVGYGENAVFTNNYVTSRVFCDDTFYGYCGGLVGFNNTNTLFLGSNTFVAYGDDNAINCFGGVSTIEAGNNITGNCSTV